MMAKKTKDYETFIFREDNRAKIDQVHVKRLVESIRARNLLELRPITVNSKMEVIDGQHRLLAAKQLGVEIFYVQEKNLSADDIIRMNVSKAWTMLDYLNFFCRHEYAEYRKLEEFMAKHSLNLKVALNICIGNGKNGYTQFKTGQFKFEEKEMDQEMEICWETILLIKKMNGHSPYTSSSRFWRALLIMTRHENFDAIRWRANLKKMIGHFCPKATIGDYLHTMQYVHNWHNNNKISIPDDDL